VGISNQVGGNCACIAVLGVGGAWAISEFQQQREVAAEKERLMAERRQADEAEWAAANSANSIEAFEKYLAEFPEGLFVEAAKSRITALELEAELQRKLAEQQEREKQREQAEKERLLA